MKIIAVIPAYNEAMHVAAVVRGALPYVDRVIVVDDGSTDETAETAERAGAHLVAHTMNCGAGAATMTGIYAARAEGADGVVTIDADGQHDPMDIPRLLAPIREGKADLVIGTRFRGHRNAIPFIRRLFNSVGNLVTFLVTGTSVSDSQSGFKALGPKALQTIRLHLNGFEFCTEIIREVRQHGWRVEEVPIKVTYSEYTLAKGQSFSRGIITACKILLRSFLR